MFVPFFRLMHLASAVVSIPLFAGSLQAQAPTSTTQLPANPIVGDTIHFAIDWGSSDMPLENASSFQVTINYQGVQIDPQDSWAISDIGDSWYLENTSWVSEISVDTSTQTISLLVDLPVGTNRSGHGYVMTLFGGPIITIDDETLKRPLETEEEYVLHYQWYSLEGKRIAGERPLQTGLYIRESISPNKKPIRKLVFIH